MKEHKSMVYKGCKILIYQDNDSESPRNAYEHDSIIFSNSRSYNPDKHSIREIVENPDYQNIDYLFDTKKFTAHYVWLRVYAYIHGGITISCSRAYPYNDKFDSGLFGIIAIPVQTARQEHGWAKLTERRRTQIENLLKTEIKELDDYYAGEVYGFVITSESGEELDSCNGYFGESGLLEIESQYKSFVDNLSRVSA